MFCIIEFRKFIEKNIIKVRNNSISNKMLLDGLTQFDVSLSKFFNKTPSNLSQILNKRFDLKNKPSGVSVNNYFLNLFGFKKCVGLDKIFPLSDFNKNKNYWDGLSKYSNHFDKIAQPKMNKLWQTNNKDKKRFSNIKYKTLKFNSQPNWLTKEQLNFISQFYSDANCLEKKYNIKFHVDHIIPLQGKYVSGLHVPWNLQILSSKQNHIKSNYHESEKNYSDCEV